VPAEEPSIKSIFPQAKNAIINKVLIESSHMNVNIIKEHTLRLDEQQPAINTLQDKIEQSSSDRNLFISALKETSETKQKLDEQYERIVKLTTKFKDKQEKQEKQAIETFTNFISAQKVNFDSFKSSIEIEYLEFFKSRQRIRSDWSQHCKKVKLELEGLVNILEAST